MNPTPENLAETPVAIIVWHQAGCPSCESFVPKFQRAVERYQHCFPVIIADVNEYPDAANAFGIVNTPTTVISRYGRRAFRSLTGDMSEDTIGNFLYGATLGIGCEV